MKKLLHSMLESKGIQLPEKEYDLLAAAWASYEQLRTDVEQAGLDDFNMLLLHIPNGGSPT